MLVICEIYALATPLFTLFSLHDQIFEAAPQEARGVPSRNPAPDYFL